MAETKPSKHLWLELKPDYIDANFDQVLSYLQSFRNDNKSEDTFYRTTLDLMRQRAQELIREESTRAIGDGERNDAERDCFHIKILCLYLLTERDTRNATYKEAYFTLLSVLARFAREKNAAILETLLILAFEVISCENIRSTGITWDIYDFFSIDIVIHKIISGHSLADDPKRSVTFERHGIFRANMGKIQIAATNSEAFKAGETSMIPCMSFLQDTLQVLDSKTNKIKQSENNSLVRIDEFTSEFVARQAAVRPYVKKRHQYSAGDIVDVELVAKGDTLRVRTIDPDYEPIEGDFFISNAEKLLYYKMDDFRLYLNVGDQFPVKIQSISVKGNSKFSVDEEFKDFVIDVIYKEYHPYKVVLARLMDIMTNKHGVRQMVWWTEFGFPAYTEYEDGISVGQYGHIELSDTGADKYRHFVNAYYDSPAGEGESFDDELSKKTAIQYFIYDEPLAVTQADEETLGENLPGQLCRLLYFYQRTIRSAADRYRLLCTCKIIAELVGDSDAARYISFVSDYLEDVVAFADDEYDAIKELSIPEDMVGDPGASIRADIVKILKEYGREEDSDILDGIIADSDSLLLERLAKLVQSANRIKNVVSENLLVHIKKEIIANLSVDTESKTDLEENKGVYYGIEDVTKEFKPSFFEAPDNSRHPQNWIIFKEICAFLNSELGGTLYLGVQDSGYSSGLERDMVNLRKIGNKAYADNIDGYKRYILDDARKYFENRAVLMNLSFTPLENGNVLAIKVNPWTNGIVEMDGQAFIRIDSESPVMDVRMKDDIVRRKLLSKKDDAGIIRDLMKAQEEKKMVNLHGYSSSSRTGTRHNLEPFAFDDDYQTVWCYDPEYDMCRAYKVTRIGSVEVLADGWKYSGRHRQGDTDIFRMAGDKEYNVEMQMDQFAKLLLCEEFPKAVDLLVPNPEKTSWYLQTKVRAMEGVGRFYMGLGKQHITLMNSPELEEYVRTYVTANL